MTLLTLQHCLFCYKHKSMHEPVSDSDCPGKERKNAEICHRYCILVSRYLNLDLEDFQPDKTIKSKWAVSITHACDNCVSVLESFCEMYEDLQLLQLEMSRNLERISKIIVNADFECTRDNDSPNPRKELEKKLTNVGYSASRIYNFRSHMVEHVKKAQISQPLLELVRLAKNSKHDLGETSVGTKLSLNSGSGSDSSEGADDVVDSSSDEDLFTPVWVNRPKTFQLDTDTQSNTLEKRQKTTHYSSAIESRKVDLETHRSPPIVQLDSRDDPSAGRKISLENDMPAELKIDETSDQPAGNSKYCGKRFQCKICWKCFSTSHGLIQHKQAHVQSKQFICKICWRPFKWKRSLDIHTIKHLEEDLERHMGSHT